MSYIPQRVLTDSQIFSALLALGVFSIVMWFISNWTQKYVERKKREIEEELKELEQTGELH